MAAMRSYLQWGSTLAEIGAAHRVTRERVRQITQMPRKNRLSGSMLQNPTAVLQACRAPGVHSFGMVLESLGFAPLTNMPIRPILDALGATAAVLRLWRIRRGAPLRRRREAMVLIIRREMERLGRDPTWVEVGIAVFGKDYGEQAGGMIAGHWSPDRRFRDGILPAIRKAAGMSVSTGNYSGSRIVVYGSLRKTLLTLSRRPNGVTVSQLVTATHTTPSSVRTTIQTAIKKGDIRSRGHHGRRESVYEAIPSTTL